MSSAPLLDALPRSYDRLGDERLAVLAGRGDSAAQEAIHGRYADALLGYCRSIVRDPDDAQDVLQQTMLNALQALERRELQAPLRPWLFRIAHNTSISLLRRRRPTDELQEESMAAGHGVSPETEMLARERLRELVDDVAALPERQRTALLLHDVAGLPHAEVAAELGCSDGASRQTVTAARTALREAQTGRDVPCADVRRMVDAGDRRRLRARPVQAHLRTCAGCGLRAARATPAAVGGEPGGLLGGLLSGIGVATTVGAPTVVSGFAGKAALVLTFAASAAVGGVVQGQVGPPTRHVSPRESPAASAPAPAAAVASAPAASRSVSGIANVTAPVAATLGRLPAATEEVAKSDGQTPDFSFGPRPVGAWSQSGQSPTVGSVADRGRHRPAGAGGQRSIGSPSWHRPSPYRSSESSPDQEPRPATQRHPQQEPVPSSPSSSGRLRPPRSPTASSPDRPEPAPDAPALARPEPSTPTAPATDTTSTSSPPADTSSTTPSPEPTSSTSEDSPTEPSSAG